MLQTSKKTKKSSMKIVIVGDERCGKTALLIALTANSFSREYVPTMFDTYITTIELNNLLIDIKCFDTSANDDCVNFRLLSYPQTDVFIIAFDVSNRASFDHVYGWFREVNHHCSTAKIILVGTNIDKLKDCPSQVSEEEIAKVTYEIGAVEYIPCSALTKKNLDKVKEGILRNFHFATALFPASSLEDLPINLSTEIQIAFFNSPAIQNRIRWGKLTREEALKEAEKITPDKWQHLPVDVANKVQQLISEGFTPEQACSLIQVAQERGEPIDIFSIRAQQRMLPFELQTTIVSYLDTRSLQNFGYVSRWCRGLSLFAHRCKAPNPRSIVEEHQSSREDSTLPKFSH